MLGRAVFMTVVSSKALILGLAVVVRGGASDDELRMQVDSARAVLEGWRTSH